MAGTFKTSVSISIKDVGVFVLWLCLCVFVFFFWCWCVGGGVYVMLTKGNVFFPFEKRKKSWKIGASITVFSNHHQKATKTPKTTGETKKMKERKI